MFDRFSMFKKSSVMLAEDALTAETSQPSGLVATTKVATARGWTPVGELKPGDLVLTFDSGLQTVTNVSHETPWAHVTDCPEGQWPLEVPKGALGNDRVMHLMGNQNIMVETDVAEEMYGDPFSLIPAGALNGLRGIERVPPTQNMEIVHVTFAEEQVVFGEHGALYLCLSSRDMVEVALEMANDPLYAILPMYEARIVASSLSPETSASGGEAVAAHAGAAYA